jgi:hypothetical protein
MERQQFLTETAIAASAVITDTWHHDQGGEMIDHSRSATSFDTPAERALASRRPSAMATHESHQTETLRRHFRILVECDHQPAVEVVKGKAG